MIPQQKIQFFPTCNRVAHARGPGFQAWIPALLLAICCAEPARSATLQTSQTPSTQTSTTATASTATATVEADGGVVSYQGRLTDGGFPTSGSFDFQFLLKDAATAGKTVGEPLAMTLQVQNGVFSASLAWKPSYFDGSSQIGRAHV